MAYTLFSEKDNVPNTAKFFDAYSLLNLLPDLIKDFPLNFNLSTNNGKYKFNKDLLYAFIPKIKNAIKENNDLNEFHFDIDDDQNIMKKVESLFKGESVDFFKCEKNSIQKIAPLFLRDVFPKSMLEKTSNCNEEFPEQTTLRINFQILFHNIRNLPRLFTIKTNQNEYKCNCINILCSNAILTFLKSNPNSKRFNFNYNEENHEFQIISDFLNGCNIIFNKQNKELLLSISEQLDIKPLVESINNFTQKVNENITKAIECQKIFEPYKELFENLINIRQLGSEKVIDFIIKSNWFKSKLEVQEFVACFLHVIKNNFSDHSILADLIKQLSEQADFQQETTILIQFLINKLFLYFDQLNEFASFLYHLYRNNLISIDLIIKKIFIKMNAITHNTIMNQNSNKAIDFTIIWFFPELFEKKIISNELFEGIKKMIDISSLHDKVSQIRENYGKNESASSLADKIRYMRDNQGQNDSLIQSIRNDDINLFQTIVTQCGIDIHKKKIQMTIFDGFQGEISYIDYSAFCGSVKCFKYLFLEDVPINSDTFMYSISGGNTEIIHILDQNKDKFVKTNKKGQIGYLSQSDKSMAKAIETSIRMHKNDIFDWIFENQNEINSDYDYLCLIRIAAINGNTHAISQIIVNVLNLNTQQFILTEIIEKICTNGFYKILEYFSNLISFDDLFMKQNHKDKNRKNINTVGSENLVLLKNSVSFGLLSIFELVLKYQTVNYSPDLYNILITSVCLNNLDIVKYILDNKFYELSPLFLIDAITNSIYFDSEDVTNYFLENVNDFPITERIFEAACSSQNFKLVKFLFQKAKEKNVFLDFTKSFEEAICPYSDEIIDFFIKNKVDFILNEKILQSIIRINPKIIISLINNETNPDLKNEIIDDSLECALSLNNIEILKFLISNKNDLNGLLIKAVKLSNFEVVQTILDYDHSPEFINEVGPDGTALFEAVKNSKNDIVEHLLQIEGIDPSISVDSIMTPLIEAVYKNDIEAVNLILNFYGDDIKYQQNQIQNALKLIQNKQSQKKVDNNSGNNNQNATNELLRVNDNNRNIEFNNETNNKSNEVKIFQKLSSIKNLTHFVDTEDLLSNAIVEKNVDLVKKLLTNESIDLTKRLPLENTYLHLAIDSSEITPIQKLLINHPNIDINSSNKMNETPLIKAIKNGNKELVDLILSHPKFNPKLNHINYAFFLSIKFKNISRKIIKLESLDVNYKYQKSDCISNPLIESIKINDFELIELITNHPSFNPIKSKINECIFLTIELKNINLFRFFVKLNRNDISIKNRQNQSLLYLASLNNNDEILNEILENENFDPNKSDIQNIFIHTFNIDTIKKLISYDEKHHYNLLTLEKIDLINSNLSFPYSNIKENFIGYDYLLRKKEILPQIQSICTSIISNQSKLYQQLYKCETCNNDQLLCEICAKVCHKGHQIIKVNNHSSHYQACSCSNNCKCKSIINNYHDEIYDDTNQLFKIKNTYEYHSIKDEQNEEEVKSESNLSKEGKNVELRCTLDLASFHPLLQPIYHCKKCQVEICQNCAIQCHKGHSLEFIGMKPDSFCYCLNITDCKCTERKDVVCTFAFYGKQNINQPWFNCETCGMVYNNGCCAICAKKCHHGHKIKSNGFVNAICDCGTNDFNTNCKMIEFPPFNYLNSCTNRDQMYVMRNQRMYHCLTCGIMSSTQGICEACAIHCHFGHNVVFVGIKEFACECYLMLKNHFKLKCLAPLCPVMKNTGICKRFNNNKDVVFSAFVCFTCAKDGKKLFCESCAVKCHKNHDVHFIGYSNFKCFCEPCQCTKK